MNEIHKILCNHFSERERNFNITLEKTELIEIDYHLLDKYEIDLKERLKIKLSTGVCSSFLVEQLCFHKANYGEKFGEKIEFFNVSEILQLIENLEKKDFQGLPFNNEPLKSYKASPSQSIFKFGIFINQKRKRILV